MKLSSAANTVRPAWQNNKPFLTFLASLLLIYSVLKIIFYNYNHPLLLPGTTGSFLSTLKLVKWSLICDLLCLLSINTFLLLLLQAGRLLPPGFTRWITLPAFMIINTAAILLNVVDIFYFRFRFQRANADLFYVIDHPFSQVFHFNVFILLLFALALLLLIWLLWKLHRKLYTSFVDGRRANLLTLLLIGMLGAALLFRNRIANLLLPAYPLVELSSNELPAVQNSFHSFVYSVFRGGDEIPKHAYLPAAVADNSFRLKKTLTPYTTGKKNVVLFIMESVPYDFFDSSSVYKVAMPFFDSLLRVSTFYKNAFGYSHESNKGITAILAGIPTLTDIPFYHSQFTNIPVTKTGTALGELGYHSLFCIGDPYDNFGFAKCANWLGFDAYYCEEDIAGYQRLSSHPMGLQDEAVLPFFYQKIDEVNKPFFAVHYNISTHYPYTLPGNYSEKLPATYTAPMKSMRYYDHCLQQFFNKAKTQSWFSETVFIFCSDHWLVPDDNKIDFNAVTGYRIPLIFFDPGKPAAETRNEVVSQLDVMGTVLSVAGYKDSISSYGGSLTNPASLRQVAFAKPGATLYQVTDSTQVLGFNTSTGRVEYFYNYKKDPLLKTNLATAENASPARDALTMLIKSFIQKAGMHYSGRTVK